MLPQHNLALLTCQQSLIFSARPRARNPSKKKIPLHHEFADPSVGSLDQLVRAPRGRTAAEHLQQAIVGARLSTAQLVRVDPVAGGDRLHRLAPPHRLNRELWSNLVYG